MTVLYLFWAQTGRIFHHTQPCFAQLVIQLSPAWVCQHIVGFLHVLEPSTVCIRCLQSVIWCHTVFIRRGAEWQLNEHVIRRCAVPAAAAELFEVTVAVVVKCTLI
jgi:hypothetical protein